jgi:DNA invertase Pin-like site-specific DNA recombinase
MAKHSGNFIAYYRVSTDKRSHSGLGLDAQKKAVTDFLNGGNWCLIREFEEIERGKDNDRPQLRAAMRYANATEATLIIAKLERLSRNAAFLRNLRDAGVKFVCADMPEASELTIGIMALVAQNQREAISRRTREALQARKARGLPLGNPSNYEALRAAGVGSRGWTKGADANRKAADKFAADLMPVIEDIMSTGIKSHRGIATQLNNRGIQTARGGVWNNVRVARILARTMEARAFSENVKPRSVQ